MICITTTLLHPALWTAQIPPTAVGGSFTCSLQTEAARPLPRIPPTAVGGSFKSSLQLEAGYGSACFLFLPLLREERDSKSKGPGRLTCRPHLNNPPTAVGGILGSNRAPSSVGCA